MWNVIMFNISMAVMARMAHFSPEFQRFTHLYFIIPCLVGNILCYQIRFGSKIWDLKFSNLCLWMHNWLAMTGIGLVGTTKTAALYILGFLIEPYLPGQLQGYVQFSRLEEERGLRAFVYFFWILFCVLLVTLPAWKRGYDMNMKFADKEQTTISYQELSMDLFYQACGASSVSYFGIFLFTTLRSNFGFRVHLIHLMMAFIDGALANFTFQYNGNLFHELMHKIPALYNMAHAEHHICKSIHPANSGLAFWELWLHGGGANFALYFQSAVPFMTLQLVYCGLSFIPHTMSPWLGLSQWHVLHHTAHADFYAASVPSSSDKQKSTFFRQHSEKLNKLSLMFRNVYLPDLSAFALSVFFGLVFHYGFGTGLFYLDWSSAFHKV